MPRALIFANGSLPDPEAARALIRPDDLIIAADGGTRHVLALGHTPAVIIGDLDSLPEAGRHEVEAARARIIQYSRDKNETDLSWRSAMPSNPGRTPFLSWAPSGIASTRRSAICRS